MSAYQGTDKFTSGATEIGSLPAWALFRDNADTATTPELTQDLRELIAKAGNAHGMAEGYFRGSQNIDEDGNYVSNDEKERQKRQKIVTQSAVYKMAGFTISGFNKLSDDTEITQDMYHDVMQSFYEEKRLKDQQIIEVEERCDKRQAEITEVEGQVEAIEEERTTSDLAVAEAKTEVFLADSRVQVAQDTAAIFDANLQRVSDGTAAIGRDNMVYDVTRNDDGTVTYSYQDEASRTIHVAAPDIYTTDELEALSYANLVTVAINERKAEAATENYETVTAENDRLYQDTSTLLAQLRERIATLEAEQLRDSEQLTQLQAARDQLNSEIEAMSDEEVLARLESGQLTVGDIRSHTELLERIQQNGTFDVAEPANDVSVTPTAYTAYDTLADAMEEKQFLISRMKETEAQMQEKIDYLESDETKKLIQTGKIGNEELYSYMGNEYMEDYAKRYPSVVRLPVSEQVPNMTPIPNAEQNMTPAPAGWYSQVQSWLHPEANATQQSADTNPTPISASNADGQGIQSTLSASSAFGAAVSGQTQPNMTQVTPEMLARAKLDLMGVTTPEAVAEVSAPRISMNGPLAAPSM
jgi:hypothetical protein